MTGVIPGTLASAIEKAREASQRADPSDLRTRSYAQYVAGLACRDLGRLAEASGEFQAGVALFAGADPASEDGALAFPIYTSLCAWGAEVHAAAGDFDRALASGNAALRMGEDLRHPSSMTIAGAFLGYVHIMRGDLAAAVGVLERGLAISHEHDLVHGLKANGLYLAWAYLLRGERERGLDHLQRALERSTGSFDLLWTRHWTVPAHAYLAAGRLEEARTAVAAGLAAVAARHAKGYLAPLLRLDAEILALENAGRAGGGRLPEALEVATKLGMRPEAAHCRLALARLDRGSGKQRDAEEHLRAALTLYRDMSMGFWLERAEAVR